MGYDLLFQQALSLHEQGRLDEAESLYRRILETAPQNPDLHNLLGMVAQAKGLHSEAVNWFYRAVRLAPDHAPFYFNLALSLDADHKPSEAADAYMDALRLNPSFKEACYQLGVLYLALNQTSDAEQMLNRALQIDPDYAMPKAELALMHKNETQLQADCSAYPQEAVFPYYLSRLHVERNEPEAALAAALEADRRQPAIEEIVELIARLQLQTSALASAQKSYRRLLELNPKSVNALINLANFATNEDNFELAEKYYKKALDIAPGNLDGHLNYGSMLYRQQRLPEALEEYRSAVIIDPERPEISNNLGLIQKDIGEYEEALGLFFNAFLKNPACEEISINLYETLTIYHKNNPEQACKLAKKWLDNSPNNVFAQHLNAAFKGEKSETDQLYAQKLFDHFADRYDHVLQRISYQVPAKLREITQNVKGTIIDLGCGTGLVGQNYQTVSARLIGVDISGASLERAGRKGYYAELINDDISHFVKRRLPDYAPDLIIAADVFGYIGALDDILPACFPYRLAFSIETLDDAPSAGYRLNANGRYSHHPAYIENLLKKSGYTNINQYPLTLRQECGQDVAGIIFTAEFDADSGGSYDR